MITDPQRVRRSDPGDPDICNVFEFHKKYSPKDITDRVNQECRSAKIGCVECKGLMAGNLIQALAPIREKRAFYENNPGLVEEIIASGNKKARAVAQQTMADVRAAMNI
jgi:tryptophanyl-tRNA synthetase